MVKSPLHHAWIREQGNDYKNDDVRLAEEFQHGEGIYNRRILAHTLRTFPCLLPCYLLRREVYGHIDRVGSVWERDQSSKSMAKRIHHHDQSTVPVSFKTINEIVSHPIVSILKPEGLH